MSDFISIFNCKQTLVERLWQHMQAISIRPASFAWYNFCVLSFPNHDVHGKYSCWLPMFQWCSCNWKKWWKCIFRQSGDKKIKIFPLDTHHGGISPKLSKHERNWIFWGKTVVDKKVWVKGWMGIPCFD